MGLLPTLKPFSWLSTSCSQISRQILPLAYFHAIFCISPNSLLQRVKLIF